MLTCWFKWFKSISSSRSRARCENIEHRQLAQLADCEIELSELFCVGRLKTFESTTQKKLHHLRFSLERELNMKLKKWFLNYGEARKNTISPPQITNQRDLIFTANHIRPNYNSCSRLSSLKKITALILIQQMSVCMCWQLVENELTSC